MPECARCLREAAPLCADCRSTEIDDVITETRDRLVAAGRPHVVALVEAFEQVERAEQELNEAFAEVGSTLRALLDGLDQMT